MNTTFSSGINPLGLLDQLPDCVAVVDDACRVCYANATWRATFAVPPAPFNSIARDAATVHSPVRQGITAVLRGQTPRFNCAYDVATGATSRRFDLVATPLRGQPDRAIVRLSDAVPKPASEPTITPQLPLTPSHEETVLRISRALFDCPFEFTAIANCLAEQLCHALGLTSTYILTYDPVSLSLTVMAEWVSDQAKPQERESDLGAVYHVPTDFPDVLPYLKRGQVRSIHRRDTTTSAPMRRHMEEYAVCSMIHLPVLVRDDIVACASLWESRQRRVLSADEVALCLDVAHFAAFLLQNVQLSSQTETARVERHRAEANLQATELRYRTLVEQLPTIIYINPPDETCSALYVSPQIKTILGYDPDECVKDPDFWVNLIHPDDSKFVEELCHQANITGTPLRCEYRMVANDGRIVWVRDEATLIYNPSGTPRCWQGILYDITQQKNNEMERVAFERQMFETQKLESLGVLAGGIAHDFNNLLAVMIGNADLAYADRSLSKPTRESIDHILLAGHRAADIVQQMLAYAGQSRFVVEQVSLNMLLREITLLLSAGLPKNITLHHRIASTEPTVRGDATQLRQVLMNLVVNAAEALQDKPGVVEVTTKIEAVTTTQIRTFVGGLLSPGNYVAVRVRDTGVGMDDATKQKIFEPFFTTKFTGRGLGLATVLGIVRQHDGTVTVESTPGQGSTVTVLLPYVAVVAPAALEAPAPAAKRSVRGKLLIIDDETDVRDLLSRVAERLQIEVLAAEDGPAGIALFQQHHATISNVLLDVTMPHMHGGEVFQALHDIDPNVPVVLMSGYSAPEINQRFGELAIAGFLQKPFTVRAVRECLA